jgi:death-on-curing protein
MIVDNKMRLAPELIEPIFDEMCSAMEMNETIINRGVIDSAVFKANRERDLFDQTAVSMYEIARHHAFSDGNKRAAYLVASYVLGGGGYKISANPYSCRKLLLKIAQGRSSLKEVKKWIRKHAVRL